MAWDKPVLKLGQFAASSDYNDAVDQFCCMRLTTAGQLVKAENSTLPALGVLQGRPSSGTAGDITVLGVTKVRVLSTGHSGILPMTKLAPATGGGVIPSTVAGHFIFGRSLDTLSSASTGIITMIITQEGLHGTTGSVAKGGA